MTNTHVVANSVTRCLAGGSLPPAMPVVLCVLVHTVSDVGQSSPEMPVELCVLVHTVSDVGQSSPATHVVLCVLCILCSLGWCTLGVCMTCVLCWPLLQVGGTASV